MQRLATFKAQVKKVAFESIKDRHAQEMSALEQANGVYNTDKDAALKYFVEKFMTFYMIAKKSYMDFAQKSGLTKNEKDFQDSMSNTIIAIYVSENGKLKFNKTAFSTLYKERTAIVGEEKMKKNLRAAMKGVEEAKLLSTYYKNKYVREHLGDFTDLVVSHTPDSFEHEGVKYRIELLSNLAFKDSADCRDLVESLQITFFL